MKKLILSLCAAVLVVGLASSGFAATSLSWTISVSISSLPIDLVRATTDDGTRSFGTLAANINQPANDDGGNPRLTLNNAGFQTIDYGVTASSSNWALGTAIDDRGADRCVLAGVFTRPLVAGTDANYNRTLLDEDFGTEDVLGAIKWADVASQDTLARNDSLVDPDDQWFMKGYDCPSTNSERSLRLFLQTPSSVTAGNESNTFTVIISAQDAAL